MSSLVIWCPWCHASIADRVPQGRCLCVSTETTCPNCQQPITLVAKMTIEAIRRYGVPAQEGPTP